MDDSATTDELAGPPIASFRVTGKRAGLRLDLFLRECLPKMSRQGIQRAIRARVTMPGRPGGRAKQSTVVRDGELVVLTARLCDEPPIPDELIPTVLYTDAHLVAADKPAGLAVHASRHTARQHLIHWMRENFGASVALGHRLDRETSGVVLCTRDYAAARRLSDDFAHGRVRKEYVALVEGVTPEQFEMQTPVGQDLTSNIFIKQWTGTGGAPSFTRFEREAVIGARHSLVRAFPGTGRRHQIRVHLAAAGHPVVGDKLYARGDKFFLRYITWGFDQTMRDDLGADRQLLHAERLIVRHPIAGTELTIAAPLPADFARFISGRNGGFGAT